MSPTSLVSSLVVAASISAAGVAVSLWMSIESQDGFGRCVCTTTYYILPSSRQNDRTCIDKEHFPFVSDILTAYNNHYTVIGIT